MARQRSTYSLDAADGDHELQANPTLGRVVEAMRRFAMDACEDPDFRELVTDICSGLLQGDYNGECLACYYWVCQNIRYMKDPLGVEMVQTPQRTVKVRSGDCDDMATLLAAMLLSAGHRVRFCLVGFHVGGAPSHVYVEVFTPGGWKTLDPVANRDSGEMLGRIAVKKNVLVHGGRASDDAFSGGMGLIGGDVVSKVHGQVFSVFDYPRGVYRYYAAPLAEVPASGFYRRAGGKLAETMAARLPSNAQPIGEGPDPQGIIASTTGAASMSRTAARVLMAAGAAGVGWYLWRRWKRAEKKRARSIA